MFLKSLDHPADLIIHGSYHGCVGTPGRVTDLCIPVQVGLRCLIRRVRRGKGDIEKKRRPGIVIFDQPDRIAADQLGDVALLLQRLVVPEPVTRAVRRLREVVDLTEKRSILVVEPPLPRPVLAVG